MYSLATYRLLAEKRRSSLQVHMLNTWSHKQLMTRRQMLESSVTTVGHSLEGHV